MPAEHLMMTYLSASEMVATGEPAGSEALAAALVLIHRLRSTSREKPAAATAGRCCLTTSGVQMKML